jgi:GNAT superfamily N-acetyltransferase
MTLRELAHRLYNKEVFYGTIKDFRDPVPPSSFPCYVRMASANDMRELHRAIKGESRESRYQLLVRMYRHQRGFGDCYVTLTLDSSEICHVSWFITPAHITSMGWTDRFPGLPADTILSENIYTFERFRRKGVQRAAYLHTKDICEARGFKYEAGYVAEDNIPEMIACEKDGWKVFNRVLIRHFLFRVTCRILERYEPPAGIRVSKVNGETASGRSVAYSVHLVRA